jgi:hypothetical protein
VIRVAALGAFPAHGERREVRAFRGAAAVPLRRVQLVHLACDQLGQSSSPGCYPPLMVSVGAPAVVSVAGCGMSPPGGGRAGSCRWVCRAGAQRCVAGLVVVGDDFADGGAGGGVVDEGLACGPAGEECLPADVVDGAGVAAADLVDERDGVRR